MSRYQVSFDSVDFGRRVEMAVYDTVERRFLVPKFELTEHGRPFMAGSPELFKDFVEAIILAWNQYNQDVRRKVADVAELYAEDFMGGFNDGRPPEVSGASDEGDEGADDHDEVRPRR